MQLVKQVAAVQTIAIDHPIILFFQKKSEPVPFAKLDSDLQASISDWKLDAESVLIPLISATQFQGVLILGKRVNEALYAKNDLSFLSSLQNFLFFVFERLKPYEETKTKYDKSLAFAEIVSRQSVMANLLNGIAHEVRNPLFMLKTESGLIDKFIDNKEKVRSFAGDIHSCVNRTMSVLDKMLKYAKTNTLQIVKAQMDIQPLILEMVRLYRLELTKRNIQVETHFSSVPSIFADETGMYQVLLNLFLNAVQAIDQNGTITITVQAEKFERDEIKGEGICVSIADTGKGISKEDMDRIFEPFFTTKYSGQEELHLGFGLSIVVKIVDEHNGFVTVNSELGKGAVFKIYLPEKA